jgi:hypothetical protein
MQLKKRLEPSPGIPRAREANFHKAEKIKERESMPPDTKKSITRHSSLLPKLPVEAHLSSEHFTVFCREHDLADTGKEHVESSRDRPYLYGKDSTKNACILFFHHLFQTRPCEFLEILTGFFHDFREWNALPLPFDAIKKECLRPGLSEHDDEFLKKPGYEGS